MTLAVSYVWQYALESHNTENSKQIFLEMKLRGLRSQFNIHVSVSDLYIPTIGLPIRLQENRLEYINRSQIHDCGNLD